jgi:hypothetical protein
MFVPKPMVRASLNMRRLVQGVGINDADYITHYIDSNGVRHRCPFYTTWGTILSHCYSKSVQSHRPNYVGCTIEESWKTFSVFKEWMQSQDWQGKHLDKDLINWDSKHYGPDTCLFISPALNSLLCLRTKHRGEHPLGVTKATIKKHQYFIATCSFYGKQTRLGYFKTSQEAADKYKEAKLAYIAELASNEKDPRIRQALLNLY